MTYVIIIVAVVVSIVMAIVRIDKLKTDKERRKLEEERKRKSRVAPDYVDRAKPVPKNLRPNPFPDYREKYFAESKREKIATLTPAQYNEWLLDFAAAEKANAPRPEAKGDPVFKRYLYESGFSYRFLRKLSGYAPQNRLYASVPAAKSKPANMPLVFSSGKANTPEPERKFTKREKPAQKLGNYALPCKSGDVSEIYESFYKGRD